MTRGAGVALALVGGAVALATITAAWRQGTAAAPASTVSEASAPVSPPQAAPRFDPAAIEAMKKQLLAEPKIVDLYHQDAPVDWTIGVMDDGTSRVGYAGYVCLRLREKGLVDNETDVRIVDAVKARRSGDWRAASLGHIACKDEADMGV